MELKYDLNVGALYIRLADQAVARTREIDDNTVVDIDADGGVIGIEVISIGHPWALDDVLRDYAIPAAAAAQLRAYFKPAGRVASQEAPAVSLGRNAPVLV
jgi:uncharacterized protein YuzE